MEENNKTNKNKGRTRCEIWSRCIGYLRPLSQYNEGLRASVKDRKMFKIKEDEI